MQVDFWNDRYKEDGFAYGTKPNVLLKEQEFQPKSKILCLAEGEGRNAVYLATLGHQITAIDISQEGIKKAQALATSIGVQIETICTDLSEYTFQAEEWDAIVIVFGHFPTEVRKLIHGSLYQALKKGGKVVIEAYSKEQLKFNTGGPMIEMLLYSTNELKEDFKQFSDIIIEQKEREVQEGKYHNGNSSVIQLVATKI